MKKGIGIALAAPFVLLALLYAGIVIANNAIAMGTEAELRACPQPEGTEIVESLAAAAKMEGNGNGMEYYGILLVRSALDEDALHDWYAKRFVGGDQIVMARRQETPYVFEYGRPRFANFDGSGDLYAVSLRRFNTRGDFVGELLDCDLRGH